MKTVFHARFYGRFIKITTNLKKKKLHKTNQGSTFLGSNRDNVRTTIQLGKDRKSQHLKSDYSSRTDQSIFTSKTPATDQIKQVDFLQH